MGIFRQLVSNPTPCDNGEHLVMGEGHVTERWIHLNYYFDIFTYAIN